MHPMSGRAGPYVKVLAEKIVKLGMAVVIFRAVQRHVTLPRQCLG
jgi:hypothetical protein